MTSRPTPLLPAGLYDLLPPKAAHERNVSGQLAAMFEQFGYAQVSPPLMEFEDSLLTGRGAAALSAQTYRVMDSEAQKMMGFRPDITLQVGRIATTRMAGAPRPLRLSYGGSTLRVSGEGKDRARQWRQAGIELIGLQHPAADAEVIAVSVHSMASLGVGSLVADLNFPGLVRQVLAASAVDTDRYADIENAVECKDSGWLGKAGLQDAGTLLAELVEAAGSAQEGMQRMNTLDLPPSARRQLDYVQAVIDHVQMLDVPVELTIDPVENKGFEYHSQVSFSLFSRSAQRELGRGGRYNISGMQGEEPATGATLYVNTLLDAVSPHPAMPRLLVAHHATLAECVQWQKRGFITVRALEGDFSPQLARQMECSHIWLNGDAQPVEA